MRGSAYRIINLVLAAVFVLTGFVSGTLGWQSLSQRVKNEAQSEVFRQVELLKQEKKPDGTETEIPVPGAAFYLFTEDGTQIGGRYVTDENGTISVSLKSGKYYFEESAPAPDFTFDTDIQDQPVTRYPFTVTGEETEAVVVTAYNIRLQGALSVQKLIENADGSSLTDEQIQQEFVFTVAFSDGGTYTYTVDGGEPQELTNGGTLQLKHNQTAVFEQIPVGVTYTVTEEPVPDYTMSVTGHTGTITEIGSTAQFTNTYTPGKTGSLTVSKEIVDASLDGAADISKEFIFTAVIGGKAETFVLKHGESKTFSDLPMGTEYTVTETDYTAEGYAATVNTYTGAVTGEEELRLPFVNVCHPPTEAGSLTVQKEVVGDNAEQDKEFTFEVTFSDSGTYFYSIDGGEPQEFTSGGSLVLKGGQTAVFGDLPDGITYTVKETDAAGYLPAVTEAGGTIAGAENALILFQNRVPQMPEQPAIIRVTKELAGEYPEADENKEFYFTLAVDGTETQFTLKPGESKEFEIPAGAQYEVREDDYSSDGYALRMENGAATALPGQMITVTATNTYIGEVKTEIEGKKTWDLGGHDAALPESITVQLKSGDLLVEEISVTPDENSEWHYTFTAPKYDAAGEKIAYTVEELPVVGFVPSYDRFDILNTYIPPVEIDPPLIEKAVEGENPPETEFSFLLKGETGAPMPQGSDGNTKIVRRTDSGEIEIGTFSFHSPGVYTYAISELNTGEEGWKYDNTIYTLTFTVTLEEGALHAEKVLTKEGKPAEKALFTNTYDGSLAEPDTVEIAGAKTWNHGDNPNPPASIIVYVYADGKPAAQWLVTAKDGWKYTFTMPKYAADGHEITYTVGEADVPGYTAEIHGYDIFNTYTGIAPALESEPSGSGGEESGMSGAPTDGTDVPQTGDTTNLRPWITAMVLSLLGIIITLLLEHRTRRKVKHFKCR
jgi:pilin isopeptide linkage protein